MVLRLHRGERDVAVKRVCVRARLRTRVKNTHEIIGRERRRQPTKGDAAYEEKEDPEETGNQ